MKVKEFIEVFDVKNEVVSINEWQKDCIDILYKGGMYSIPQKYLNYEVDHVRLSHSIEWEEKILLIFIYIKSQENSLKIKPCPFCCSKDIELSIKHVGRHKYHIAMFCKKCHCYGPREIVKDNQYSRNRDKMYEDGEYLNIAIRNWNKEKD